MHSVPLVFLWFYADRGVNKRVAGYTVSMLPWINTGFIAIFLPHFPCGGQFWEAKRKCRGQSQSATLKRCDIHHFDNWSFKNQTETVQNMEMFKCNWNTVMIHAWSCFSVRTNTGQNASSPSLPKGCLLCWWAAIWKTLPIEKAFQLQTQNWNEAAVVGNISFFTLKNMNDLRREIQSYLWNN